MIGTSATFGWRYRINSVALAALGFMAIASADEPLRVNPFGDPFVQVTAGFAGCATPAPPAYTEQQIRDAAHERAQRGVSCWLDGRCRLHNSYLYDAEIVPRVKQAIVYDGRFADTSVWVLGQRRHVWLKGCVRSAEQAELLVRLVSRIDDVERVVDELTVGASERPPYATGPSR